MVEVFEDFVQMVVTAGGGVDLFSSAHLADQSRFRRNVMAADVAAITCALSAVYRVTVELGEQDMGDGMEDRVGCAFEEV